MKCSAPRYWWTYQRRWVNAEPKGFDKRAGTPAGQPTRELVGRVTVFVSGNPAVFFNKAGTSEQVSKEFYMVSARLVLQPVWLDFVFALFSFTPTPFLPSSLLFLCSLTAAHRFGRFFHFGMFGPIACGRQGVLLLPFNVDYLVHGPPRGRAAALRIWPRSTLRTRAFSLSLATQSTTGPSTHVSGKVERLGHSSVFLECGGVLASCRRHRFVKPEQHMCVLRATPCFVPAAPVNKAKTTDVMTRVPRVPRTSFEQHSHRRMFSNRRHR